MGERSQHDRFTYREIESLRAFRPLPANGGSKIAIVRAIVAAARQMNQLVNGARHDPVRTSNSIQRVVTALDGVVDMTSDEMLVIVAEPDAASDDAHMAAAALIAEIVGNPWITDAMRTALQTRAGYLLNSGRDLLAVRVGVMRSGRIGSLDLSGVEDSHDAGSAYGGIS